MPPRQEWLAGDLSETGTSIIILMRGLVAALFTMSPIPRTEHMAVYLKTLRWQHHLDVQRMLVTKN